MQQTEQQVELSGMQQNVLQAERDPRLTAVQPSEGLAALAHDARNMIAALDMYCDLLEEPGVLTPSFLHYGRELKLVATSSRRLVEQMGALEMRKRTDGLETGAHREEPHSHPQAGADARNPRPRTRRSLLPALPIDNLAAALLACRNLLDAMAGPAITLTMDIRRGELPVQMNGEDLTRILVNLVKNAADAMLSGGRIRIALCELPTEPGTPRWVTLTIEDNGPGIPRNALDKVFEPGYTNWRGSMDAGVGGPWQEAHRGLGLSIVRSLVEAAGGGIHAALRDPAGACFQIELPVRSC